MRLMDLNRPQRFWACLPTFTKTFRRHKVYLNLQTHANFVVTFLNEDLFFIATVNKLLPRFPFSFDSMYCMARTSRLNNKTTRKRNFLGVNIFAILIKFELLYHRFGICKSCISTGSAIFKSLTTT